MQFRRDMALVHNCVFLFDLYLFVCCFALSLCFLFCPVFTAWRCLCAGRIEDVVAAKKSSNRDPNKKKPKEKKKARCVPAAFATIID